MANAEATGGWSEMRRSGRRRAFGAASFDRVSERFAAPDSARTVTY